MAIIFITGATGFLGQDLTRNLLSAGNSIRILARSAERAKPLCDQGAELFEGEITDRRVLNAALQGCDLVFHVAGKLYDPSEPVSEYYRIHEAGTQALLECCQAESSLKRLIHVSTTGVLGVTGDQPLSEDARPAPTNVYEDSKWKAELLVRQAIQSGFPAVIVRPGLVYGPGDLHLLGFFKTIKRGLFRPIGSQPAWLHPIYIDDMTAAIMLCSRTEGAIGDCFHIAGKKPVTIEELACEIAISLGKPQPSGRMPYALARAAAFIGDLLPPKWKARAPLTSSRLDFLTHSRVYDISKAHRLLGFTPAVDLPIGLLQTIAWYRQHGYL